jgi:hypothetical protein
MVARNCCLLVFLAGSFFTTVADACTVPLPQPPMWVLDEGMQNGKDVYLIGVELGSLFEPDPEIGTTCACGLQFRSPLPFGSEVTEAFVAVTDRDTHEMTLVPGFDFTPNVNTTEGLQDQTESFGWFGLATDAINSVVQPTVEPNEALKLWFRVEVDEVFVDALQGGVAASHVEFDPSEVFSPDELTFAAGSAQPDGTPNFDGEHPMVLFEAVVPEPSTLLLAMLAGLGLRRRLLR